jgi:toxin YoeB
MISWYTKAWLDYLYWQQTDKTKVKRINELIKDILREPFAGIGKPEALKHEYAGWWSRRIDDEHHPIYSIKDDSLIIIQCRYHYKPKG